VSRCGGIIAWDGSADAGVVIPLDGDVAVLLVIEPVLLIHFEICGQFSGK
jgi:hypothetical protein